MDRAYSTFEIKNFDEQSGVITGIASTPTPDRMDDIVEADGAEFKLPIPLLWQHDSEDPIGNVTRAKVTSKGIEVTAQVAKGLTSRIDAYWKLISSGLVRGLSIGFRGLESSDIEGSRFGRRYTKWAIPANAEANITTVKEFDTGSRAASGIGDLLDTEGKGSLNPASGNKSARKTVKISKLDDKGDGNMKTIAEQIADWTDLGR